MGGREICDAMKWFKECVQKRKTLKTGCQSHDESVDNEFSRAATMNYHIFGDIHVKIHNLGHIVTV